MVVRIGRGYLGKRRLIRCDGVCRVSCCNTSRLRRGNDTCLEDQGRIDESQGLLKGRPDHFGSASKLDSHRSDHSDGGDLD